MSLNAHRKRDGYSPLPTGPQTLPLARPAGPHAGRRTVSPGVDIRRHAPAAAVARTSWAGQGFVPGSQAAPPARQKDKFVPLPDEDESVHGGQECALEHQELLPAPYRPALPVEVTSLAASGPTIFEDLPLPIDESKRGRITLYCIAEEFDRKVLDAHLKASFPEAAIKSYPDVFYVEYLKGGQDQPGGDVFFFDYGVVACWGMTELQEMSIIRSIGAVCQEQALAASEVEIDELEFNYSAIEKPHIQNDTVTLHKRHAQDHKIKLAISYALSQSTKLSVYENRVVEMVTETRHLPETLAEAGQVDISSHDIAKLIGKVFIQKAAVNLLSSVLDTPEFFWHAPDSLQALYERICEYLELSTRVEVLNSRFQVLQEMLDMLRDHQNNYHNARLEWIVIWLIVVEVLVGLLELAGLFGLVGGHGI